MTKQCSFTMLDSSHGVMFVPGFDGVVPGSPRIMMSTRIAGSMTYIPGNGNIRRNAWLKEHGINPESCQGITLEHGKVVHCIDTPQVKTSELTGDGIILLPNMGITSCAVTVADCVPIFIVDRVLGIVTVLHSGYKGTGILQNALELLLSRYGSKAANLAVILGPHIQACCYDIDEARAEAFSRQFGSASVVQHEGKLYMDLTEANIGIALRYGLGEIMTASECTACNPVFGSYRREGPDQFTRMLAVITCVA